MALENKKKTQLMQYLKKQQKFSMDSGEMRNSSNFLLYRESLWQSQQKEDISTTGKHGNIGKNAGVH